MAKLSDRQKLINRINARLRSYNMTPEQLEIVQKDLSSIEGVYQTKKGISIDKTAWTMNGPDIEKALEYKVKTQKERREEAIQELKAVGGAEAVTPEAVDAKMSGKLYTESLFQDVYDDYYEIMPHKEEINPAELKEDPLKSKLYDDMVEFGGLVRRRDDDSKALELKASILEQIVAIKERDDNEKSE